MPYRPWNQSQVWNNKGQPLGTINPEILRENLIALIAVYRYKRKEFCALLQISNQTFQSYLERPEQFRLSQLFAIAEFTDIPLNVLLCKKILSDEKGGTSHEKSSFDSVRVCGAGGTAALHHLRRHHHTGVCISRA